GTGPVLRYVSNGPGIPLPFDAGTFIGDTLGEPGATDPAYGSTMGYNTYQNLIDVTGDGRPDLVYWNNGQMRVAHNEPDFGGSSRLDPTTAQLWDGTLNHGPFEIRSSLAKRFNGGSNAANIDYVWRQAIDVNGDGRIDIIDASEEAN